MKHRPEVLLAWLLRISGAFMVLAWVAVILPGEWMAASHRALGLGEIPQGPLVDYLTRSISALYGIHGGLFLVLSTDVRRLAKVVRYIGVMNVVFGLTVTAIDLHAGMPLYWTLAEGPPVVGVGLLILWLIGRIEPTSP